MRILVAEDDVLLGEALVTALRRAEHVVDWVRDGQQALAALRGDGFDVVLLDLGLPQRDGMEVLAQMRRNKLSTPVLILTARDGVKERVRALDLGADDYLCKPFDRDELLARLRALHRRSNGQAQNEIEYGELRLNPASRELFVRGAPVDLTRREYMLLSFLLEQAGRVATREATARHLYGWTEEIDSNALDVHVHALRKKLWPGLIRTIRGVGYMVPASASER
jgi:DNA-binding response OmpR family regulator